MLRRRKTYTSCADLPLYNFIQMVVHGKYDYIYSEHKTVLNRNFNTKSLYSDIFSEYTSLSDNHQNKHIFELTKDIEVANNKLIIIHSAVSILLTVRDEGLIKMLKGMGFFMFTYSELTMDSDLKKTLTIAKSIAMRRDENFAEYAKIAENNEPVTEDTYYGLIREISRFNKFPIDVHKTTVLEFMKDVKAFEKANTPKQQQML